MQSSTKGNFWRWTALVMVLINATHGLLLSRLHPGLPSIAEVSQQNESLFTPAGYAFAIWGLIYAGFALFCIFILLPEQRKQPVYEPLARGLVAYALLGMVWAETFIREEIGLSVLIIAGMFAVGALMFGMAKNCLQGGVGRAPLYAPFSLFFGWISVAALANVAGWLKSLGWDGGAWGETPWAVTMIVAALVLALVVSRRWRDSVYPLVILWSLIAIWEHQRNTGSLVEYSALASAMLLTLWTLINAGWIRSHSMIFQPGIKPTSPV